jgi:DNA repair exonuclease SbcCD nuclease subunit
MKFLHTADWQMGMKADSVGLMAERVRDERLEAAKRVVQSAKEQGAGMILLTGDVFEDNAVDRLLVRKVGVSFFLKFSMSRSVISFHQIENSAVASWN